MTNDDKLNVEDNNSVVELIMQRYNDINTDDSNCRMEITDCYKQVSDEDKQKWFADIVDKGFRVLVEEPQTCYYTGPNARTGMYYLSASVYIEKIK